MVSVLKGNMAGKERLWHSQDVEECFGGTHVSILALVDHLLGGGSVDEFLRTSPPVSFEQIAAVVRRMVELPSLTAENQRLLREVDFLQRHSDTPCGVRGESLVAMWVRGEHTAGNAESDVLVSETGLRLEVKYSRLNIPYPGATTKRWNWQKILGEFGNKEYDRLVLIGEKDERFPEGYGNAPDPWVIFDLPFEDVQSVVTPSGRWQAITLTTNPLKAKSRGSALYRRYRVSVADIEARYGACKAAAPLTVAKVIP